MRLLLMMFFFIAATMGYAQPSNGKGQKSVSSEKVEATQVPESVLSNFESSFDGALAVRWEKQVAQGNKAAVRYVAIFTEGGVRSRARYKEDGTPLSSSKYYGAIKLPELIKKASKEKYPDFTVMGGEEITTRNGKTFYRVRSRKGSTKMLQYFDADGNEINKSNAPEGLMEGEEDGN